MPELHVLVIVPPDDVRGRLRVALGASSQLRARTYQQGLALAEQNALRSTILWSPTGADARAIETVHGLRMRAPTAPIVVITPTLVTGGIAVMDTLRPRAYLKDSAVESIVAEALRRNTRERRSASPLGVPVLTVPPTLPRKGGTSSADH